MSAIQKILKTIPLWAIFLFALIWNVLFIWNPYPWSDEGATVLALDRSWNNLWILGSSTDIPLVPYYIVGKIWISLFPFLSTLVAIRLFSAFVAAGTAALLFLIVKKYSGWIEGYVAFIILLLIPNFVRYSQEARPYAFLTFLATLSWFLFFKLKENENEKNFKNKTFFVLTTAILPLIHVFGILQWVAQAISILFERNWKTIKKFILLFSLSFTIASYPLYKIVFGGSGPKNHYAVNLITVLKNLIQTFSTFSNVWTIYFLLFLMVVSMGLNFFWKNKLIFESMVWFLVPLFLSLVISLFKTNLLRPRYWQPLIVPASIIAGVGTVLILKMLFERFSKKLLVTLLLIAAISMSFPLHQAQKELRSKSGHGMNFSKILQVADENNGIIMLEDTKASPLYVINSNALLNGYRNDLSDLPWIDFKDPDLDGRKQVVVIVSKSNRNKYSIPDYLSKKGFTHVTEKFYEDDWLFRIFSK